MKGKQMSVREKIFWIEGVKEGQKLEQERIIKLLEKHKCTVIEKEIIECWCGSFNEAIALIKGEQK
jgi:hypothetical protein